MKNYYKQAMKYISTFKKKGNKVTESTTIKPETKPVVVAQRPNARYIKPVAITDKPTGSDKAPLHRPGVSVAQNFSKEPPKLKLSKEAEASQKRTNELIQKYDRSVAKLGLRNVNVKSTPTPPKEIQHDPQEDQVFYMTRGNYYLALHKGKIWCQSNGSWSWIMQLGQTVNPVTRDREWVKADKKDMLNIIQSKFTLNELKLNYKVLQPGTWDLMNPTDRVDYEHIDNKMDYKNQVRV